MRGGMGGGCMRKAMSWEVLWAFIRLNFLQYSLTSHNLEIKLTRGDRLTLSTSYTLLGCNLDFCVKKSSQWNLLTCHMFRGESREISLRKHTSGVA
ncbi:hypothetical protein GDO81_008170 [Engystomops pustulosus]|uniref:Secreted protein n=1 Tax=Engystomops pustulosus TaxID=76066 RepID=A0AAV7CCH7_ENGPU|nr:hypothetical protein GDO81_008170 [Engystomops pustulosus]